MKISLFLGAGASTNYGMPTTRQFKEDLARRHARERVDAGKNGGEPDVLSDLLSTSNSLDIEHVLLLADTIGELDKTEAGGELIRNSGRLGRQLEDVMRIGKTARREVFTLYEWGNSRDEHVRELLGPLL